MRKSDSVYLNDILNAISHIEEYLDGIDFEALCEDERTQDAVIRRFEIIGEAANRLSKTFKESFPDFPIRQSKDFRNFLAHEYDQVLLEQLWKTIEMDIPTLKAQVVEALNRLTQVDEVVISTESNP